MAFELLDRIIRLPGVRVATHSTSFDKAGWAKETREKQVGNGAVAEDDLG